MTPPLISILSKTSKSRQKVLGYPVDVVDHHDAVEVIESAWASDRRLHVVTVNSEMIVAAQRDAELDRIIRHAHLIIPDGAGVVWALKFAGVKASRVPGIELAYSALEKACESGRRVALLGGKKEVLDALKEKLSASMPTLNIVSSHDGYFTSENEDEVVDQLSQAEPQLLLVALGVPKQEYFIDKWHSRFPNAVMVGVGGSFDVWAGISKRAPKVFQQLNLEWFYRLLKEPWRYKRMGSTLPNFAIQVIGESIGRRFSGKNGEDNHSSSNPQRRLATRKDSKSAKRSQDKSRERSKDR